jgi:hypothetical protein
MHLYTCTLFSAFNQLLSTLMNNLKSSFMASGVLTDETLRIAEFIAVSTLSRLLVTGKFLRIFMKTLLLPFAKLPD